MIRALIFDFDGLILDTESALIRSYADIHEAHRVPFDYSRFLRAVGHADYTFQPWSDFPAAHDRIALEAERQRTKIGRLELLAPLPGVIDLLDEARAAAVPIAVASNSEHSWVESHLARLGLVDRFAFIACREDVPSPKPEPDLYKLVLQHFGLRGHEAIAFEDSHTGVTAATAAGLFTVAVPHELTRGHDLSRADLLVGSLTEVSLAALAVRFAS